MRKFGELEFLKTSNLTHLNGYNGISWTPFSQLALFGDSISQNVSTYLRIAQNGTGATSIQHTLAVDVSNQENINVALVNSGANQTLSATVIGTTVTVNLKTDAGGVITSTTKEIGDYLNGLSAYTDLGLTAVYFGLTNVPIASSPVYLAAGGAILAKGYATQAQILMKGRFELVKRTKITGFAFQTGPGWAIASSAITANQLHDNPGAMGDLIRDTPSGVPVLVLAGSNDIQGGSSAATTFGYIKALWDAITMAGHPIIGAEILPLNTSGRTAIAVATNALCKSEAILRKIPWIEWPASLTAGGTANGDYFDSDLIHPNLLGAQVMGVSLASQLDTLTQPTVYTPPVSGSPLWKTLNPYFTGGSGIATSWSPPSNYGAITSTASKETINGELWQVITITQPSAFNVSLTSTTGTVTSGELARLVGQFKVSTGFKNINIQASYNGAGGSIFANRSVLGGEFTEIATTLDAWEGTLLSGWEKVPHGATSVTIYVNMYGEGTVKFRAVGLIGQS